MKTYKCKKCGYVQDFSPNDIEKMRLVFRNGFPKDKPIKKGQCPSCKAEKAF